MKKVVSLILVSVIFLCGRVLAEQAEIMKAAQKKETRRINGGEEGKEKIYTHSLYEYSWIKQGSKIGNWRVFSNRLAYLKDGLQVAYVDSTGYGRFGVNDATLEFGSYQKLKDGYIHGEYGLAVDHADYVYKMKGLIEIEQRLTGNWFVNFDTRYLHYTAEDSGDAYIFSPSLLHYFGNNYVSVGYGTSVTKYRDLAQFGVFKGNFALNDRVNLWLGTALGERLFDINILPSSKQYGSFFFGGFDVALNKNITLRIGGSYSKERPSFIKRSVDFGAKIKF